ncbi:protein FRIGIDA-like [Magnolia sinica]|uniref:protein FRIGIDA-like n=1 Tax=Magnolia sinica TaxID=86752 RepID=UPI00265A9735|nr:protein FRIGIDA-like [Magnolia sinica]
MASKRQPVKEGKKATAASATAEEDFNGESPLLKSVSELDTLSSAISTFTLRFNELQNHLNSILTSLQNPSQDPQKEKDDDQRNPAQTDPRSDLQRLCDIMDSRGLRKYIVRHLSEIDKLRTDISEALKRAPNLPRLVLDCIGRFYLQGIKAYAKDAPMVATRRACILVLEVFLASGCSKIEGSLEEEAKTAAVAWRSRLIQEGGISKANSADALGLLLFVAAFGIPSEFGRDDLYELIQLSDAQKNANVLCHSHALLERIQDIIQGMLNKQKHVEAVRLSCAFSLKGELSPLSLLSTFVKEINQTGVDSRKEGQFSYRSQIEANQKHIAGLKSVVKCFEDHKLNDSAEFAKWKIHEKIAKLEKEISKFEQNLEKRTILKRKTNELGSSVKVEMQEAKRHQPTAMKLSSPRLAPAATVPSQEQSTYKGLLPRTLYDGGFTGSLNGLSGSSTKPDPSLSNGSSMRLMAGNVHGALSGHGAGVAAGMGPSAGSSAGIYAGNDVGPFAGVGSVLGSSAGPFTNDGVAAAGSGVGLYSENGVGGPYSGVDRELSIRNSFESFTNERFTSAASGVRLYTLNGVGSYTGGGSGTPVSSAGPYPDDRVASYRWHGDATFNGSSAGQGVPPPAVQSLMGSYASVGQGLPPPAVQSFMGSYASAVPSHRGRSPDMYQFADTVLEREYSGSHTRNTGPPSASGYPPTRF